jgi:hypothetical protein
MAQDPNEPTAFDPHIQSEDIAYKPDELVTCGGCGRANPPNRLHCLYCAHQLEIAPELAGAAALNLRKLEVWERGFNLVLRNPRAAADAVKIAALLSTEAESIEAILDAGVPLPLARVESEKDAAFLQTKLDQMGVNCSILADADLAADKPAARLSGIDFGDGTMGLRDFNTGDVTEIGTSDLVLIVDGLLSRSQVDSLEKKRRRSKENKIIEETATSADEAMLDLYARNDPAGFRVHLTGFDFSCLGERKGMLATENLQLLTELLVAKAPTAKFVDTYDAVRQALGDVWEVESRKDSQGLLRVGFGKREFGTVASTSNLNQFTKYSRLQRHLL